MAGADDLYQRYYTHERPDLGRGPVSLEPYISAEYFEREQRAIFDTAWIILCVESELPEVGSYLVKDVPLLGSSVIVVRGADRKIRAFRNACRHRGNQLVYEECRGKGHGFTCKFHAWTYGLDGSLRGMTEKDRFLDVDQSKLGLAPVTIDTWNGLIFVTRATPDKLIPLREYLGTMGDALSEYPFDQMTLAAEWKSDLKVNWKTMIDAFQEGYHVNVVHRNTAPSLFCGGSRPVLRLSHFRFHGNHRAVTSPKNPDFQPSVTEAMAFGLAGASLAQKAGDHKTSEIEWKGVNPMGDPDYGFDINVVFPATFIDTSFGWFFTYEFWPMAVDRTLWVAKLFVVKPRTWAQRIGLEFTIVQLREALLEDLTTLESTQRGMASGAMTELVLSDQELAIRHHHAVVEKMVRGV